MHTIRLGAVDSRDASDEEIASAQIDRELLPPGFRLRSHQARTIAALRDHTKPVVINSAMTGDGKSFAGLYLALAERQRALIAYPTNELARDQMRSIDALLRIWQHPNVQRVRNAVSVINAEKIDELDAAMDSGRSGALDALLQDSDIVLTNPDIFHLIMQFRYRLGGAATDAVAARLAGRYRLFIFDEFHIFGTPENCAAVIAMSLLRVMQGEKHPPRFLFLSATTTPILRHLFDVATLPYTEVNGVYTHNAPETPDGHSRIMQPVNVTLIERGEGIEAWITLNLDRIIAFFQTYDPARGAIIVQSVATAFRVYALIAEPCRAAGIDVAEPNTGLTPQSARRIDAQLIIATSTVDVGVDFRINLLIFESHDAASHKQRLGRLGRHSTDNEGRTFSVFEAYAILPGWVIETLVHAFPEPDTTIDRERYGSAIEMAFPTLQGFEHYRSRWARVQAGQVLNAMQAKEIKYLYAREREMLRTQIEPIFPGGDKMLYALMKQDQDAVVREASAFRGSSPFTALVENRLMSERAVLSYDLVPLLRSGVLEHMTLDDAYRSVGAARAAALKRREPIWAVRLVGWLKKPRKVTVHLDGKTEDWNEPCEVVIEQSGFSFVTDSAIPEMMALKKVLASQKVVAILIRHIDPKMLQMRYKLGLQVELFEFEDLDGVRGTVAFGRDALLMDSIIYRDRRLARQTDRNAPLFG